MFRTSDSTFLMLAADSHIRRLGLLDLATQREQTLVLNMSLFSTLNGDLAAANLLELPGESELESSIRGGFAPEPSRCPEHLSIKRGKVQRTSLRAQWAPWTNGPERPNL
jgi:hypothetical protein